MILPLGVPLELRFVEVDVAQIARAIPLRLIVEMRRPRMPALSTGSHGFGAHRLAELHHRDEAVAARAVPLLCPWICARSEGRKRPPRRGGKADWNAGACVIERLHDVASKALESIDIAPRSLPG